MDTKIYIKKGQVQYIVLYNTVQKKALWACEYILCKESHCLYNAQ